MLFISLIPLLHLHLFEPPPFLALLASYCFLCLTFFSSFFFPFFLFFPSTVFFTCFSFPHFFRSSRLSAFFHRFVYLLYIFLCLSYPFEILYCVISFLYTFLFLDFLLTVAFVFSVDVLFFCQIVVSLPRIFCWDCFLVLFCVSSSCERVLLRYSVSFVCSISVFLCFCYML